MGSKDDRALLARAALYLLLLSGVLVVAGGAIAVDPDRPLVFLLLAAALGALAMSGVMVMVLRARADLLISRLSDAARTDPLTGLLNRRGFDDLLGAELARAQRYGRPLSLVFGDLDRFKEVNDSLGHTAGDTVLKLVAERLRRETRTADLVGRYGGEEFVLLLPETDEEGALILAERLRAGIVELFAKQPEPVTISFGVATFEGADGEDLVRNADRALYAAKLAGRNRSIVYGRESTSSERSETPPEGRPAVVA